MLIGSSCHLGICGRLPKSAFAWLAEGSCQDVSIPKSMVHLTSEFRSFDVYEFNLSNHAVFADKHKLHGVAIVYFRTSTETCDIQESIQRV